MCGIKGSLCKDDGKIVVDEALTLEENVFERPFAFVDSVDGLWSIVRQEQYSLNNVIKCPIGGKAIFWYPNFEHDVVLMADQDHYNACDFRGGKLLSPAAINENYDFTTYYHPCDVPGQIDYISCSIGNHCGSGQKIVIETSSDIYARNETTQDMNFHVDSLSRILKVLGHASDPVNGIVEMNLGYQTEEIANITKDWIWCGLDHCPEFYDLGGSAQNLNDDCVGAANTLLGFIERKKPIPDYTMSEKYYRIAIDAGGLSECDARSYLTKMFLDKGDFENATTNGAELCQVCGNGNFDDPYGPSVRQARNAFEHSPLDWPCPQVMAASSSPVHDVSLLLFLFVLFSFM